MYSIQGRVYPDQSNNKQNNNTPTCHCKFHSIAALPLVLYVHLALVLAGVGGSGQGQRVEELLRAAGGLGVDHRAILVYDVRSAQRVFPRAADDSLASHCHIGAPCHIAAGIHGQRDIF